MRGCASCWRQQNTSGKSDRVRLEPGNGLGKAVAARLREEVQEKYREVVEHPDRTFHFHTGLRAAANAGYRDEWLEGRGVAIHGQDCAPPTEHRSEAHLSLLPAGTYHLSVGSAEFGNGIE